MLNNIKNFLTNFKNIIDSQTETNPSSTPVDLQVIRVTEPHWATPPTLPFSCRFSSYQVSVDQQGVWACSCPKSNRALRVRILQGRCCMHCAEVSLITGLSLEVHCEWPSRKSGNRLTGKVVLLREQELWSRVVDGYVIYEELLGKSFTPGQVKKFLGEPDEIVIFDIIGPRNLYMSNRVNEVLGSREYHQTREKHLASIAKARATRERNKKVQTEKRASERAAFSGRVYAASLEFKHGWEKWGVYAENLASARRLFEQELTSEATTNDVAERFRDAMEDYRLEMSNYREELREQIRDHSYSDIVEPVKPIRSDFVLKITSVEPTTIDKEKFEINEVELIGWGGEYCPGDVDHIQEI